MQPITELAVGTLKLDGTAEAVTAQQASELLPMWEVYKQLVSSDTAAQAEIDGLRAAQIRASMTEAQQQSITAMKLGERDVFAVMQPGPGGDTGPRCGPMAAVTGRARDPLAETTSSSEADREARSLAGSHLEAVSPEGVPTIRARRGRAADRASRRG